MLFASDKIRLQIDRERELGHDVVPIGERLKIRIPLEDAYALVDHLGDRSFDAGRIAWDLGRLFGDDGFDAWVLLLDERPRPNVVVKVWGRYDARRSATLNGDFRYAILFDRWQAFKRERCATDLLLIDVLDDHRDAMADAGWQPTPGTKVAFDQLCDIAEAQRTAREFADEAATEKAAALYDEWFVTTPAGQAAKRAEEAAAQQAATFKAVMQAGGFPMPAPSVPSAMPLLAATAAAVDLGHPILDGFLAGQQGRPADDAPAVPATVQLAEPLNTAIRHIVATAERSPATFRAGIAIDALGVLAFLHEPTFKAVVACIRGFGCALPDGKLTAAVRGFEARVSREVRAGSGYLTNQKGDPDPQDSDNLAVFLRLAGVHVRFNAWRQRAELRWADGEWVPLTDAELNRLRSIASQNEHRFRPSKEWFRDMLADLARQNSFDPVLDRLDAAESAWDGASRLATWLTRACGVPCDPYHQAVGKNIVGGIVRRARHPGCKFDTVAIFTGRQGCGKSTLTKILALDPEWHTDSIAFEGRPQDLIPQMAGRIVIELSELDGLHRRDVGYIKRFLSTTTDNFTAKYEALASDRARRCVFIGTCNLESPLVDDTGNRRFYPVRVPDGVQIDLAWLQENIAQLIGEAAALESAGEVFDIPREVWADAAERQEAARNRPDFEILLDDWFGRHAGPIFITAANLARLVQAAAGRVSPQAVGSAMRRLGFERATPRVGASTAKVWCRGGMEGATQFVPRINSDGFPTAVPVSQQISAPPLVTR